MLQSASFESVERCYSSPKASRARREGTYSHERGSKVETESLADQARRQNHVLEDVVAAREEGGGEGRQKAAKAGEKGVETVGKTAKVSLRTTERKHKTR